MKPLKAVLLFLFITCLVSVVWLTATFAKQNNESLSTSSIVESGGSLASKITTSLNSMSNLTTSEPTPAPPLVKSARNQIGVTIHYDPAYVGLDFPMGDVPKDRGVCTDVVIRAYREQGTDLQVLVNTDMKQAWSEYPKIWGLKSTDKNIDHRRVPNLQVFFKRHGQSLAVSKNGSDYLAGDIVTWKVHNNLPHIGIVSNKISADGTPLIIHNMGLGTQEENILFAFDITGHYRY